MPVVPAARWQECLAGHLQCFSIRSASARRLEVRQQRAQEDRSARGTSQNQSSSSGVGKAASVDIALQATAEAHLNRQKLATRSQRRVKHLRLR